jgi:hypothetical protein
MGIRDGTPGSGKIYPVSRGQIPDPIRNTAEKYQIILEPGKLNFMVNEEQSYFADC